MRLKRSWPKYFIFHNKQQQVPGDVRARVEKLAKMSDERRRARLRLRLADGFRCYRGPIKFNYANQAELRRGKPRYNVFFCARRRLFRSVAPLGVWFSFFWCRAFSERVEVSWYYRLKTFDFDLPRGEWTRFARRSSGFIPNKQVVGEEVLL